MKENKNQHKVDALPFDEGMEIFGEHKTREQVRAEDKLRKKQEREALKQELKRRRTAGKGETPTYRKDVIVVSVVLGAAVLLLLALLFTRFHEKKTPDGINEARGHFDIGDVTPAMSGDEPMVEVGEAYFTNDGRLYLKVFISNGTDSVIRIDAIDFVGYDSNDDSIFVGGRVELAGAEEEMTVEVAGVTETEIYVTTEYLLVDDDYKLSELPYFKFDIDYTDIEVE